VKIAGSSGREIEVAIPLGNLNLPGDLAVPARGVGLAIFAHGSGSSRHSPRNQAVARVLREFGIGTLLFDLLTDEEEQQELYTRYLRFDIPLLAERLVGATRWVSEQADARGLPLGYFGASTGAAAALAAAAKLGNRIRAVVSRGGRPDLAGDSLARVRTPVLLIVGGNDGAVIRMNERARERLGGKSSLSLIPGASHLFEEPGALEEVAQLAGRFFLKYFHPGSER